MAPVVTTASSYLNSECRHKSIIAYVTSINLPESAKLLRKELGVGDKFDEATSKKYEGLLEKKWTSVVRLQKKVGLFGEAMRNMDADLKVDHGA